LDSTLRRIRKHNKILSVLWRTTSLELDEWVEAPEDSEEYDAEDYYWLYESMELL